MEEEYWQRFLKTGKILDYLYYKGLAICRQVMESYESEAAGESDYGDRYGACGDACR